MRYILIFFCLVLAIGGPSVVAGQQEDVVRIGIHGGRGLSKATIQYHTGSYTLVGDGKQVATLKPNSSFTVKAQGGMVQVSSKAGLIGQYQRLLIKATQAESHITLKAESGGRSVKHSTYPDNLIFRSVRGELIAVNEAMLDHYISGVTEAEAGRGHEMEFYKVQSMIARTYALANFKRHATSGFNLCDEVHCQAYHGTARFEPRILEATANTQNQVLVDANIRLINAAFHSNCGGHTLNSEHVWSKPLPYLVGRPDSFCLVMPHSHWEKSLKKQEWVAYLNKKAGFRKDELSDSTLALAYFPRERQRFFADSTSSLRMTKVRSDWGLRSAFFVIEEEADSVRFTGRGFGHGVGLCQEGGMRMAQLGHDCSSIVHFYYKDVHIIDRRKIAFFEN